MVDEKKWAKFTVNMTEGVNAEIRIADGVAIMTFNKPMLAYKAVNIEIAKGNNNVSYNSPNQAYVEKYPGLSCDEITKIVTNQIKEMKK